MAQKSEPLAHADELAQLWNNLLRCQRRALLVLAYADPDLEPKFWQDLPTDARMRLVRVMPGLTELAVQCAVTLERAKASLDALPTLRQQMEAKLDEIVFAPMPDEGIPPEQHAEYARRMAAWVRQQNAEMRARKRRS